MKLIIAGSRGFDDDVLMATKLEALTVNVTVREVVSGDAAGADKLGARWAAAHDIPVVIYVAQWEIEGRGAGFKRNVRMAEYADALVAFWDGDSHGTGHMIRVARKEGLKVRIVRYDQEKAL